MTTVIPEFDLADKLRKVRRNVAHMSQAEFAAALGEIGGKPVSEKRYSNWEAGYNKPGTDNLVELANRIEDIWGVPAAWLVGFRMPSGGGGTSPHDPRRRPNSGGSLIYPNRVTPVTVAA
jgi:transcriptional regulator with XRE-family HTH domain